MAHQELTENIVKQVALRFMRRHYKHRLDFEDQEVVAKYDLEGAGGIIADGYYSIKRENGKTFTATFEATSKDTRDEVEYKPQPKLLFWDGLAAAAIGAVLLFTFNYMYGFHVLDEREFLLRGLYLLGAMAVILTVFVMVAKNFRRYRYIYAIEQFKKYYVNEQWIALAEDVFDSSRNRYFKELKNQCTLNGFGLLLVDKNLDPQIVITPSRSDIFVGKRKKVDLFSQDMLAERKRQSSYSTWWNTFRSNLPEFVKRDTSTLRHARSYNYQLLIAGVCASLIAVIFSKEMQRTGYQSLDAEAYRTAVSNSKGNNVPEQPEYIVDTPYLEKKKNKPGKDGFWALDAPKDSEAAKTEIAPAGGQIADNQTNNNGEVFTPRGITQELPPDCARYYNFDGAKYIIQDGVFASWPEAIKRLTALRSINVECAALLRACFIKNADGFYVYVGMIYNSTDEANTQIEALQKLHKSSLTNVENWKIVKIDPVVN